MHLITVMGKLTNTPVYGQSCFICTFYFLFTIGLFWDKFKESCYVIYDNFTMDIFKW
jgi:hypothetical protein